MSVNATSHVNTDVQYGVKLEWALHAVITDKDDGSRAEEAGATDGPSDAFLPHIQNHTSTPEYVIVQSYHMDDYA